MFEAEVKSYRCFLVNSADHFDGYEVFEAETEADVRAYARRLLTRKLKAVAVEIWQGGTIVGRVDRESS